jgi:hypothetical protein
MQRLPDPDPIRGCNAVGGWPDTSLCGQWHAADEEERRHIVRLLDQIAPADVQSANQGGNRYTVAEAGVAVLGHNTS